MCSRCFVVANYCNLCRGPTCPGPTSPALIVADFWTVIRILNSRFDRWAVLGGPGPVISGRLFGGFWGSGPDFKIHIFYSFQKAAT